MSLSHRPTVLASIIASLAAVALLFAPLIASAGTLKLVNLKCNIKGGGFMAAMVVVSGLAKQKKALQACSKGKQTVQANWHYAGGKIKGAKVSKAKSAATKACVAKALSKVKSGNLAGICSAGIVIGK